jgi:mycothiol S-conjugate amidase
VDITDFVDAKWRALKKHVTQMADDAPFFAFGREGWAEFWGHEAYILTDSKVETVFPESDLFAGLA